MSRKPDLEEVLPQNPSIFKLSCVSHLLLPADFGVWELVEVELVDRRVEVEKPPLEALVADMQCEV